MPPFFATLALGRRTSQRYVGGRLARNWSGGSREEEGAAGLAARTSREENEALQTVGHEARILGGDIREEEDVAAVSMSPGGGGPVEFYVSTGSAVWLSSVSATCLACARLCVASLKLNIELCCDRTINLLAMLLCRK